MTVAIVMPYFNEPEFLARAVAAVKAQTFTDWHLYIVDDGSEAAPSWPLDNSLQITVITQPHTGVCAARNAALELIRESDAEFVAYCDADDFWDADYLEQQIVALTDCDLVYADPRLRYFDGQVAHKAFIPEFAEYPGLSTLLLGNFIYVSGVVHRRACLEVGNFNSELNSIEDYDYWVRIAEAGFRIKKNPQAQFTYTVKFDGNASKSKPEVYQLFEPYFQDLLPWFWVLEQDLQILMDKIFLHVCQI